MTDSMLASERRGPQSPEWRTCLALLVIGFTICFGAIKYYRSVGVQPAFYQQNFGPAVMMACGYGFTQPAFQHSPASLSDFLQLRTQTFRCEDFSKSLVLEQVTWNGTWYYLYGTVAVIWKVTGLSWPALDGLAAALGSFELLALYGLFRLIAPRSLSIVAALIVMLAPYNLGQLMMLRDFSKAPFVLGSTFILGFLILRPLSNRATVALAAAFGALVGIGYGFRSDLLVMLPFGAAMMIVLLPGRLPKTWPRNLAAAVAAVVAFAIAGYPPLQGQRSGGCQFHYALLGLTLTHDLNVQSPMYAFGDHFSDTFVDLKAGDYANRVMAMEPPILCAPAYDEATGALFFRIVATFPADFVTHAYGSVLTILRAGLPLGPLERVAGGIPGATRPARMVDRVLTMVAPLIPLAAVGAVAVAWSMAPRLGIALTAFVLFLTGYPAIQFEARHWFHLRFLSLWMVLALWAACRHGRGKWTAVAIRRGLVPVAATLGLMVLALWTLRIVQRPALDRLVGAYLAAPVESLPVSSNEAGLTVDWQPAFFGHESSRRASDMLAVTVAPQGCGADGPVDLVFRYDPPIASHDMTSKVRVERLTAGPTTVFFPVFSLSEFDRTLLRFTSVEVPGRPTDCVTRIARLVDRSLPLWLQIQVPPDWRERPYYQTLRTPRILRFLE
jgi:hypothetical protein